MTPQEALAQAIERSGWVGDDYPHADLATAILEALPDDGHGNRWVLTEEWRLHDCEEEYERGITDGAKQEGS